MRFYTVWRNSTNDEGQQKEREAANILAAMCGGKIEEYSDRFDIVLP